MKLRYVQLSISNIYSETLHVFKRIQNNTTKKNPNEEEKKIVSNDQLN